MLVRSFGASGQFNVTDWTPEIVQIPLQWGTINQLGIFQNEPVAASTVTFEETIKDGALIVDRVRGDRGNVSKDSIRKIHTFAIPHFPLEDSIYPKDLVGVRAYGQPDEQEALASVRARKMERIRQNHAWTLEAARAQAIVAGTAYAPNGTIVQDFNSEFGFTRTTVGFALSTGTTEVLDKIEQCIASIQDNVTNGTGVTGVVALCSPTFFAALISHPTVKSAYQYYQSTQEPLRNRLVPGNNAAGMQREFYYGGVRFVEVRAKYNGTALIPTDEAYFVGEGTDAFKTYFAPAERFGMVGTLGEELYMFETEAANGTKIEIETESNFINAILRPGAVVKATRV